ncbi:MAG: S46 family peptidase [Acidobacteria bacterium]|nr:S46 family peptidase [Acidobacteriota bacterium]
MRRILLLPAIVLFLTLPGAADEGMWLFNKFPRAAVKKAYGFTVTDQFLNRLQLSSVRFNNGGSGSFVSPSGLLFTNHHVGADCIYQVATKQNDYMKNGFASASPADEKPCPNLEVNVLLKIETVTDKIKAGTTDATPPADAARTRRANASALEKNCSASGNRCQVVTLYSGGQYDLYEYKKYTDVRLVFAPEEAIAAFGGDPDNFTFPRYCLDFTFFRAYENGKPVQVKNFLPWSKTGAKNGELTFTSGHPGSTDRLATYADLEFQRDVVQPFSLDSNGRLIKKLLAFGELDPENKRIARDLLAGLQNSVKARTGFLGGLKDPELMRRKLEQESKLRKAIGDDPAKQARFGKTWGEIAAALDEYRAFYATYTYLERAPGSGSELFGLAKGLLRYKTEKAKPNGDRLREWNDANLDAMEQGLYSTAPIYPALEKLTLTTFFENLVTTFGPTEPFVVTILAGRTPAAAADFYVTNSKLADVAVRKSPAAFDDPMMTVVQALDGPARNARKRYEDRVQAVTTASASRIAQARFAAYGDGEYPDATFTLRLTYAPIKGYTNAAGVTVPWSSDFSGLFARATGVEPFALPPNWLAAKSTLKLKTPYDFVSTADTHGGNSGSPTVNTKGELIGILFDGNLEGLPNQYLYRDTRERSVHVASQGIIESLRKVYKANSVLKELGF